MSLLCPVYDNPFSYLHRVMELLLAKKSLSSLRNDVMPFLVARQSQPPHILLSTLPGLHHRRRPLQALDSWLVNVCSAVPTPHMPCLDALSQRGHAEMSELVRRDYLSVPPGGAVGLGSTGGTIPRVTSDRESVSATGSRDLSDDVLRCFSVLVESPPPQVSGGGGKKTASEKVPGMPICQRVTSLQTYMALNRCSG